MPDSLPDPLIGRIATGVLLLGGGAALVAGSMPASSSALTSAGLAAVAASLITSLLGVEAVRPKRVLRTIVAGMSFAIAGLLVRSVDSGVAGVATPAAGAAVLLWAALAWGRGGAKRLFAPAAVGAAVVWFSGGVDVPLFAYAVLPVALVVAEALAIPLERARQSRRTAEMAMSDIDSLLVAALDLRGVDEVAVASDRICRIGTELLRGDGALLYVQGPGRLLLAGRHGAHPTPIDPELGSDAALDEVLRVGSVRAGDPLLVPITGEAGVIGVLVIAGCRRNDEPLAFGVAQLFGSQAGAVLDRLNAVESLFDAATRDPVTGVGNRHQAAALIAGLRPGDGFLVLDVDAFDSLRRSQGDEAADLVLGQVGLHLRNGTRGGDAIARYSDHQFIVALRDLKAPIEMIVGRLVETWRAAAPSRTISVGGALHLDGDAPIDTVERAEAALGSAQRRGGGRGHIAPDWAAFAG